MNCDRFFSRGVGRKVHFDVLYTRGQVLSLSLFLAVAITTVSFGGQGGLSRNMVGFMKINVPSNDSVLVSIPFHDFGTNRAIKVTDVFAHQMVNGFSIGMADNLLLWDTASGSYKTYWKSYFGDHWRLYPETTETTNRIPAGQGFFISNKHSYEQDVYIMGEVPSESTAPTTTITMVSPSDLRAYPYPSGIGLNETTLTNISGSTTGDIIQVYDIAAQDYVDYYYDDSGTNGGGWQSVTNPGSATSRRLFIGESFWFVQATNGTGDETWTESKPYTWP